LAILICFHWNLEHSGFIEHGRLLPELPTWFKDFRVNARFGQNWVMFGNVPENVWWYVIDGTLLDGTRVDIWSDSGVFEWSPPQTLKHPDIALKEKPDLKKCIGNHRWWKFYEQYNDGNDRDYLRKGLADIICREWNSRFHDVYQLKSFKVFWVNQNILPDGNRAEVAAPLELWSANCNNVVQPQEDTKHSSHMEL